MANGTEGSNWFRKQGWIAIAGAVGGIGSWLLSISVGKPFHENPFAAIGIPVALGAFAAVAGVFLSNGDIGKMTTLVPALLFGLAWKPVLDASQDYALTLVEQRAVDELAEVLQEMAHKLLETPDDQLPLEIAAVERSTKELMNRALTIRDRQLQARVQASVHESIVVLDQVAERAPVSSARALGNLGAFAAVVDRPEISERAAQSLSSLPERTEPAPAVAAETSNSLLKIAGAKELTGQTAESEALRATGVDVYRAAEERFEEEDDEVQLHELRERSVIPRLERHPEIGPDEPQPMPTIEREEPRPTRTRDPDRRAPAPTVDPDRPRAVPRPPTRELEMDPRRPVRIDTP